MAGKLIRTALRSTVRHVRHVSPVRPRHAAGLTADVYRQIERDFGMLAPPMSLHSPAPDVLAAAWTMLRESLVATTSVSRATKEAVASAVSAGNDCPYCVEVHDATLAGLGTADAAADAAAAAADWARASGTRAGAAARRWPVADAEAAQLIGVAVTFQYLNRVVNVFLDDSPLPPNVPAGGRATAGRVLGRVMRGPALRGARPGDSLELLSPAPLPADLAWAAGEEHVALAFGRAAAAVEAAAARSVPPAVRELVTAELSTWDGRPPGLSRSWVDGPVRRLSTQDQSAARLALLVAKASYQVDDEIVAAYETTDAGLVELVSWAGLAAARRAGTWLAGQGPAARAA